MDKLIELASQHDVHLTGLDATDEEAADLLDVLDELSAEERAHDLAGRLRSAGYRI
jgi:hypothetical protein